MSAPPNQTPYSVPSPYSHSIHTSHRTPTTLLVWYWLLIVGGQILLPCLLATMILSRNVRRDPTLVSMIISWILFTIIMCILYYTGYDTGPEPPFGLCLTQASLVYGAPVMACAAGLGLVVQVLFNLRHLTEKMATRGKITSKDEKEYAHRTRWRTRVLVALPYLLLLVFAIVSAVIGARNPSHVSRQRSFFYCSIKSHLHIATSWTSAVLSTVTVAFEGWIALIFYFNRSSEFVLPRTEAAFNVRIIVRVVAFSVLSGACWLSFMISGTQLDIVPWMITACIPLVAFFVFGTQKSILRVWAFWIPRRPRPEMEPTRDSVSNMHGVFTMQNVPVSMSKATLITLPPIAHVNPFMNDEEVEAKRNSSRNSLVPSDLGDTINTLSPLTLQISYAGTPLMEKDLYGWERGHAEAAVKAA